MSNLFFKNYLGEHPSIEDRDALYYQKTLRKNDTFEIHYTALRKSEGRLYEDDVVTKLPHIDPAHHAWKEWNIRKRSADRLVRFLKKKKPDTVLEIGCGNGWLTNYLHSYLQTDCCGIDINETELNQAASLFSKTESLNFLYADILSGIFDSPCIDIIVLASVFQYFPDPQKLLFNLQKILKPEGQIHILDSPFYNDQEVLQAKQRSEKYFAESGLAGMQSHYFHHSWKAIESFQFSIIHNPSSFLNSLLRKVRDDSPFPWIVIEKTT
jgi:ubiquinone/menaquinone biosynthesis C-methylase UbiE